MPRKLTELRIDEVSLVDAPANEDARVVLFKRDAKEDSMLKAADVIGAHAAAVANIMKARTVTEDEFDEIVRKEQRAGETFAGAYSRLLNTDAGRMFYGKRAAFRSKVAVVTKLCDDTLRYGGVVRDRETIEQVHKSREAIEKSFDDLVAKNRRADETHEQAYSRMLQTPEGRDFYRRRAST